MSKSKEQNRIIRNSILDGIAKQIPSITKITSLKFNISRQSANNHLRYLIGKGLITAYGNTKNRKYRLKPIVNEAFSLKICHNQEEHLVWKKCIYPYLNDVPHNIFKICQYGFTGMFNNAIEHSQGENVFINLERSIQLIKISIFDDGIGIFKKLQEKYNLTDPREAMLELAKGKLSTVPGKHNGEGIFFTSKLFDFFAVSSENILFTHTHYDDWQVKHIDSNKNSTSILMKISVASHRILEETFKNFSVTDSSGFNITQVPVALLQHDRNDLFSRSQAKRIMSRADKFKEIILDFQGVENIGQAFADEIFRVFINQHPQLILKWININPKIEELIQKTIKAEKDSKIPFRRLYN